MSPEKILYEENPSMFRSDPVKFVLCVLLCLVVVGIPILLMWWIRTKCTTLIVSDVRTTVRRGILSKSINEVWHRDVRNVQITQSFLQRVFDVGYIGISSAGNAGVEIGVKGIPDPGEVKAIIDNHRMQTNT